jgi:hypothetical protein
MFGYDQIITRLLPNLPGMLALDHWLTQLTTHRISAVHPANGSGFTMRDNADQCVASRNKQLDIEVVIKINGREQTALKGKETAGILARLLGLKWRTVQKRRQRGSDWRTALDPKLKRAPAPDL